MKKLLSTLIVLTLILSLVACGGSGEKAGELKIGRALYAAHGERSFAVATVVLNGGKVALAHIDEYQVLDKADVTTVPNSDGAFNEALVDPAQAIASKRLNNSYYSKMMAESGGATQDLLVSWQAVEAYVVGKTAKELENAMAKIPAEGGADAVAGATLTDAPGYVNAIAEAAKDAAKNKGVAFGGDVSSLKIGQVDYAAHGDKSFATTTAVVSGDTVVLSYIDEYQFLDKASVTGVPNSDKAFGESFSPELVLASKRVNDKFYSTMMKENAGATNMIAEGYDIIQNYANGKTITEIEGVATGAPEAAVDAVAGSTLADTGGYLASIIAAAKAAA